MLNELDWTKKHIYKTGKEYDDFDTEPELENIRKIREKIEPWLCAVFQSEHLSLLTGNGLTTAICQKAGLEAPEMVAPTSVNGLRKKIEAAAKKEAKEMGRKDPNFEDYLRNAIGLLQGLEIMNDEQADELKKEINKILNKFALSVLKAEEEFTLALKSSKSDANSAKSLFSSFLKSFASRASSRERLHLFTTNYDRFIEFGCDQLGIYAIDHFKGVLNPRFHSSRLEVDLHYNPPGIRGEPRYLEGVVRFSKLHGSLDWRYGKEGIYRCSLPFGAGAKHSEIPVEPYDSLMIYPNSVKDIETCFYPYADMFRDFSMATCQPNSVLVTYGYGFGDSHINKVIKDMLTIPSTHLVIISWDDANKNIQTFYNNVGNEAQFSLLIGSHFADLEKLVKYYLPKAAIDQITWRETELLKRRGKQPGTESPGDME